MTWFDRPEGFVVKSFDERAPSKVVETDTHFVLTSTDPADPWDIASIEKEQPLTLSLAEEQAIARRTQRELADSIWD